jgi:hypothetical protein
MILILSRDHFLKHPKQIDLCYGEVWCFLCGTVELLNII